jgi:hypothetical protein
MNVTVSFNTCVITIIGQGHLSYFDLLKKEEAGNRI